MKNRCFAYETCCVNSTAELITDMVERAREVTLTTLRRHCAGLVEWEKCQLYATGNRRGGLRLAKDYAVSFFKSVYNGKPCYFIKHSAIEYIWTLEV